MTSTPNGIEGEGKFFYDYWRNAQPSDTLFERITPESETNNNKVYEKFVPNADELMNDDARNSFISVEYLWSENPIRDQAWYKAQCKELNFDKRRIGQEIDLVFIGSKYSLFDDDVLSSLQKAIRPPIQEIPQKYNSKLKIYDKIDPNDYYIIGCDTAASVEGCFSALQIFSFKDFKQIGELAARFGPEHYYAQVIEDITFDLIQRTGGRVILSIENNTIGGAIVEHFLFRPDRDFNYIPFLYFEREKLKNGAVTEYGINTNAKTKPLLTSALIDMVTEFPNNFRSQDLISQFHTMERGRGGIVTSATYSDLFMAACFAAYTRKTKAVDILPLIKYTNADLEDKLANEFMQYTSMASPKKAFVRQEETTSYSYNVFGEQIPTIMSVDDDNAISKHTIDDPDLYANNDPIISIGYDDI